MNTLGESNLSLLFTHKRPEGGAGDVFAASCLQKQADSIHFSDYPPPCPLLPNIKGGQSISYKREATAFL